jgi:hypothetical protein
MTNIEELEALIELDIPDHPQTFIAYHDQVTEQEARFFRQSLRCVPALKALLEEVKGQQKPRESIDGFEKFNRRECFADTADGLSAYTTYGQLNDEALNLREENKRLKEQVEIMRRALQAISEPRDEYGYRLDLEDKRAGKVLASLAKETLTKAEDKGA